MTSVTTAAVVSCQAFRAMTTGRPGAAHLGLPYDVQQAPVDEGQLVDGPRWSEPLDVDVQVLAVGLDPHHQSADKLLASGRPFVASQQCAEHAFGVVTSDVQLEEGLKG